VFVQADYMVDDADDQMSDRFLEVSCSGCSGGCYSASQRECQGVRPAQTHKGATQAVVGGLMGDQDLRA
jgi:hypothetical protein